MSLLFSHHKLRLSAESPVFNPWEGLMRQYSAQYIKHSIESVVMADSLYSVP